MEFPGNLSWNVKSRHEKFITTLVKECRILYRRPELDKKGQFYSRALQNISKQEKCGR
jgi:hypothetical protein